MKFNFKKFPYTYIIILMLCLTSQAIFAQEGFEDDVDDEVAAPIDGFLAIGLIAGAAYGIKKLKK